MNTGRWAALLAVAYALWFAQGQGLLQLSGHGVSLHFYPLVGWLVPVVALALAAGLWRGWPAAWWLALLAAGFQAWRLGRWLWSAWHGHGALSWTVLGMFALLLALLCLLLSRGARRRAMG